MYQYKRSMESYDEHLTPKQLRNAMVKHFQKNGPTLVESLLKDLDADAEALPYCGTFRWQGGQFNVMGLSSSPSLPSLSKRMRLAEQ